MMLGILPPLITSVTDAFLLIPGLKTPACSAGFAIMGMAFAWSMFRSVCWISSRLPGIM